VGQALVLVIITTVVAVLLTITAFLIFQHYQSQTSKTPPFAPSGVESKAISCAEIQIKWQDNSNNETGFRIYRNGVMVGEVSRNVEEYVDRNLKYATEYRYYILAYNPAGDSMSLEIVARTKNPPLTVRIDSIGVTDNGEEPLRRILDSKGEVYIGIVITDGKAVQRTDLPQSGKYYSLDDNQVITVNQEIFRTAEVGDSLHILIVGGEQDSGSGSELLCEVLDGAVKYSVGGTASIILDLAGVSFSNFFGELLGTDDDFMGKYDQEWTERQNWGIGHYVDIGCRTDRGTIGLRIWYSIICPYNR
jgi:hypothetical protein